MRSTQDEVMYGGSKMGAKTDGLLMWSIMRRQKYPRSRGLFIRRQITEITKQGAAWDRVHELLGDRVEYNSSPTHKITFPNKSVLEFNHCKDEESKQHYQGAQYDDICFDQLEQFSETQYTFIMAACRVPVTNAPKDSQGNAIQARIRSSANPGGIGHAWVKARFVDVAPPNQTYTYTETINHPDGHTLSYERTRIFIPSLLFDNPHADPRYAAALAALPDQLRDAYLYGKWDVFVGQGFPDFQARTREGAPYHVIPTEPVPETWVKAEGHDWGYASPFYHCWGAIDPQGGLVIYRELSARHWATDEIASQVVMRRGGERVATTWAGHDIFHTNRARLTQQMEEALEEKGQLLRSINEQYRMAGLNTCVIVPNLDRIAGKQKIHQLLRPRHDGIPYLRIMDCCPILIKTLSEIPIDQARVEDVETDYPEDAVVRDDPYDGFRYLVMGLNLNIQPMLPPPPQPPAWQAPVMRW